MEIPIETIVKDNNVNDCNYQVTIVNRTVKK